MPLTLVSYAIANTLHSVVSVKLLGLDPFTTRCSHFSFLSSATYISTRKLQLASDVCFLLLRAFANAPRGKSHSTINPSNVVSKLT